MRTKKSSARRLLVAAGGTGGHIFPGIAVAEEAARRGWEVRFVGSSGGMEQRLVQEAGFAGFSVRVGKIKRMGPLGAAASLALLPASLVQAGAVLARFRPSVVVGAGGYVSAPVVAAAGLARRPVILLEQNVIPGATNRTLARMSWKVAVSFEESLGRFGDKALVCGNPVRAALVERFSRRNERGTHDGPLRLLVLGGSQGARAINDLMAKTAPVLAQMDLTVRHQTGTADLDWVRAAYDKAGLDARTVGFQKDMGDLYEWADLVLCRAGATTIAELTVAGLGAILVPFPYAADDHQTANAMVLDRAGAAVMIPQKELTTRRFLRQLGGFVEDRTSVEEMGLAAARLARPKAASCVLDLCDQAIEGK